MNLNSAKRLVRNVAQTTLVLLVLSGCCQIADPAEGGLFGWSAAFHSKRLWHRQNELQELEYDRVQSRSQCLQGLTTHASSRRITVAQGTGLAALLGAGLGAALGSNDGSATNQKKFAAMQLSGAAIASATGGTNSAPFGILTEDGKHIYSPHARTKPPVELPEKAKPGLVMKCPYTGKPFRVPKNNSRENAPSTKDKMTPRAPTGGKLDGAIPQGAIRGSN